MDTVFPAESDAYRQDTCTGAQGNRDAKPGRGMTAIQEDKEKQVGDQACGCDEDILSLQPFELDRAADGPIDGIDTRCHGFLGFRGPKKGLNN